MPFYGKLNAGLGTSHPRITHARVSRTLTRDV